MPPAGDEPDEVRYAELGASWWLLAVGPVLAAAGALTELAGSRQVSLPVWLGAAALIVVFSTLIIAARRQHVAVVVTGSAARFGQERVRLADIAETEPELTEDEELARVLGGGYVPPRGTGEVALRLTDGTAVRAWARRPERLRSALSESLHGHR